MKVEIKVTYSRDDHPAIRTWGLKNGYGTAEFGPIAWEVQKAFLAAHEQALREASQCFMDEANTWALAR